jgi:putative ABC transport system substrate-binding protein
MRRRDFIKGIAGSATAWALVARATDRLPRIGVLMGYPEGDLEAQSYIAAFREGLRTLGWTEGRDILIDIRWATPGDVESMQRFAKELVALRPDVILSQTTPTTAALLQQTRTIPIVFALVSDPVGSGFVASYRRPGGNATGFDVSEPTQAGKWVELLKEITPRVARLAMLYNPESATYAEFWLNPFRAAGAALAVETISAPVRNESELDSVIAAQAREPNSGLVVMPDSFLIGELAGLFTLENAIDIHSRHAENYRSVQLRRIAGRRLQRISGRDSTGARRRRRRRVGHTG